MIVAFFDRIKSCLINRNGTLIKRIKSSDIKLSFELLLKNVG